MSFTRPEDPEEHQQAEIIALVCDEQSISNVQREVLGSFYVGDLLTGQLCGVDNPDLFLSICTGHITVHHVCNTSGNHQSSYLT
jgi:hypothetical protein